MGFFFTFFLERLIVKRVRFLNWQHHNRNLSPTGREQAAFEVKTVGCSVYSILLRGDHSTNIPEHQCKYIVEFIQNSLHSVAIELCATGFANTTFPTGSFCKHVKPKPSNTLACRWLFFYTVPAVYCTLLG